MADSIVIQVRLGDDQIFSDGKKIAQKLTSALNAGIEDALRRAQQLRQQLDRVLSPDQRHSANEAKERVHQQRLEAIQAQSAARLQEIEARKQAQLDAIRARAVQREIEQQRRLERSVQVGAGFQTFLRRYSSRIREAGESIQQAGFAFQQFITGPLVNLARASVQAAIDIDRQVNVIKALTGSAELAEKRFAQLVATAQKSPGLTTQLAATLDTQLRTLSVTEQTINRVLPAVGRLNAISPLTDPGKFVGNLVQLITQNFERQDLKELVGQSPLAGELIRQIFNVDSPTNAKAIREAAQKLGIRSVEDFFTAFANAAQNNAKLAKVTESLGAQFDKLRDRVIVALRPLGLTLIETIRPLVEAAVPIVEKASAAFAKLPEPVRQAIIILGGLAAAIGPVLIAAGALIQTFGALGDLVVIVGGAIASLSAGGLPLVAALGAIAAAVAALGLAFAANFGGIRDVTADVISFIQARFKDAAGAFEDSKDALAELGKQFQRLSDEVKPIVKALGEVIKNVFENTFRGVILAAQAFVSVITNILRRVLDGIDAVRSAVRSAAEGSATAFGFLVAPGSGLSEVLRNQVRSQLGPRRPVESAFDGEEITSSDLAEFNVRDRQRQEDERRRREEAAKAAAAAREAAAKRSESAARALRDAQLRAEQDFQRNQFELLKDANERILREEERSFQLRLLDADQFFKDKLGLLQANIGNEINLLNSQLITTQEAFNRAKPNTPERVRLGQQVNDFQTQIAVKTRQLGDVEKQVFSESVKARNEVVDLTKQQVEVTEEARSVFEDYAKALGIVSEAQRSVLSGRLEFSEFIQKEQEALEANIRRLRGELQAGGVGGENFSLRAQQAQLEAVRELQRADEEAILSMIRNRERLADASVFHADRANAIFLDHLARQQSVTEAVAEAQIKAFEGVAGSLDKGIDRLTKKLGFFGEIVNGILKSIVRNVLTNLIVPTFGGGQQAGGGGILGSILGGIFGNRAGGGFLTPGFNPTSGGGFNFSSIAGLAAGAIPGLGVASSISAPPSVSLPFAGPIPVPLPQSSIAGRPIFGGPSFFGGLLGNLGNLFKGIGFGLPAGSARGGLAGALPLLGLSLGAGLGGRSILGNILGGAGGALLGIGLTAAPAGLAGAGLGFLLPLFSNPITAIVGAALLPAAFLLGRARQRGADERASGDFLTQAINSIRELKQEIATDRLDGSQARALFENQILAQFIQQINTLKTKSVRESRLTNQVRDLRNLFDKEVGPEIEAQRRRRAISGKLVPEFAFGGIVPGLDIGRDSVLSLLRPREMVLTLEQQATIARIAGADVFARAGVPGVQQPPAFQAGGIVPFAAAPAPQTIILDVSIGMSESGAEEIVVNGAQTERGQRVIVRTVRKARMNRQLP